MITGEAGSKKETAKEVKRVHKAGSKGSEVLLLQPQWLGTKGERLVQGTGEKARWVSFVVLRLLAIPQSRWVGWVGGSPLSSWRWGDIGAGGSKSGMALFCVDTWSMTCGSWLTTATGNAGIAAIGVVTWHLSLQPHQLMTKILFSIGVVSWELPVLSV